MYLKLETAVQYESSDLEVLFAPDKTETGLRIHIALDVQCAAKRLRPAKEHTCFGGSVDFANALEDHVPVGAAKVRRCPEAGNGILFSIGVVDHDVGCVIRFDLGRQILGERCVSENTNEQKT